MKIPIVGTPEPGGPQSSFTPVNITTFDKVGEAGQHLGEAISGAGSLAARIKGAIDEGTIAKTETQAEAHFQGFADSLKDGTNPDNGDPHTYADRWKAAQQAFVDSTTQSKAVQSLSPGARLRFNTKMEQWQVATTQRVGHLATDKAMANTTGDLNTRYESALLVGDANGAKEAMETGMRTGVLDPEQAKQKIFQIPMRSEYNQAVVMMSRNPDTGGGPIVLEKALQQQNDDGSFKFYPHVIGQQREALMFDAYRNARVIQSQTAEEYAAQQASGQQADPDKVNRDVILGKISQGQAKALLRPGQLDPDIYASLATRVQNFDVKGDADHKQEGQLLHDIAANAQHLSPAAQERLTRLFNDKLEGKAVFKPTHSFDQAAYAKLLTSIATFDPTKDPNHSQEAQIWGSINESKADISPASAGRLNALFKQKLDHEGVLNTAAVSGVLKANEALYQHGGYGDFNIAVAPPTPDAIARSMGAKSYREASSEQKAQINAQVSQSHPVKRFFPDVQAAAEIKRAAVDQKVFDYILSHPGSENDEKALMGVYAEASRSQRGAAGHQLFNPPGLTPTAPTSIEHDDSDDTGGE